MGGASANSWLREEIRGLVLDSGASLLLAPLEYCSDNAAMIGRAAIAAIESKPSLLAPRGAMGIDLDISTCNTEIGI